MLSLPRSTDYGATYQKLNEKVGPKTILSYLYVSPNNKRKVIFRRLIQSSFICLSFLLNGAAGSRLLPCQ